MKSKSTAITNARQNVSLSPMGRQWRVDTYDSQARAWSQGVPCDYWQARASYAQALIDKARAFQGRDFTQYEGGSWVNYI